MKVVQLFPDSALSSFFNGVNSSQSTKMPTDKRQPTRVGQRSSEVALWGTRELDRVFDRSMNTVFCKRNITWKNEFLGKSHSQYLDININVLWASLRVYEDSLYKMYHENGLNDQNNALRVVGIFPTNDKDRVMKILRDYQQAPWVPSKELMTSLLKKKRKLKKKMK